MAAILQPKMEVDTVNGEYVKLAANPMFRELQATLIKDVQVTTNLPASLIKTECDEREKVGLDPAIVAVQEANLQSDFQQIIPTGNQKVLELQRFYSEQCAQIENERNEAVLKVKEDNMLSASQYQKELNHVHIHHDQQRMHLTNRVTASLQLLKISLPLSCEVSSSKSKSRQLNSRSVAILNEWYERHIDNPYPDDEQKQTLAELAKLSLGQVKAWFANKRNRTNNTKPKKQKMQVEKKLLNICTELSGEVPRTTPRLYGDIIQQLSDIVNSSQVFSRHSVRALDAYSSSGDELENTYSD